MSSQAQSHSVSTATGPATGTRSRAYIWDKENCAMCTSLGPSHKINQTRQGAVGASSTVHSLLHSHIAPQQAVEIIAKHNVISLLTDHRGQKARFSEGDVSAWDAWAEASGLEDDFCVYTSIDEEEVYALDGSGYAESAVLEVSNKIRGDQSEYDENVKTLLADSKVQEEIQEAKIVVEA